MGAFSGRASPFRWVSGVPSWRTFRELLVVYYAYMNEYRAEIFFWMLSGILPFILMGLWMQVGAHAPVGWEPVDVARYFFAVFLVRQYTVTWVIWEFESDVLHGRLSHALLRPLDPGWVYLAAHLAERLSRLPFLILVCGAFFLLYPEAWFWPPLRHLALFALTVNLAFAVRYLAQYSLAMLAFVMERASALESLWQILYLFLSGTVIPLAFFPEALQRWVYWTPFPYIVDIPVRALLHGEIAPQALGTLGLWVLGLLVLNRALWRWGLRRYSAMGA